MSKVPNTPENEAKCVCPRCPTWLTNGCPKEKNELLYCAKGKTICDLPEAGCICGACPMHEEYKLDGMYFCFRGAEK
jgi:hypothetical protein